MVVLTKTDVAENGAAGTLQARLRYIDPSARFVEAPFGAVDPDELLRPVASDLTSRGGSAPVADSPTPTSETISAADPGHTARTHSTSLTFDGPVDWTAFGVWFSMLLHARGEDVLRVKGLLDVV